MTLTPRSSWIVEANGHVKPVGARKYEPRPKVEGTCTECGAAFRGRIGRLTCSSRCRHLREVAVRAASAAAAGAEKMQ